MKKCIIKDDDKTPDNCPILSVIKLIGGKWKLPVLYHLRDNTLRFSEIKKLLPRVTQKMLTQQLRELEKDGLVTRFVYAEVPPRVEYSITAIAKKLGPVLAAMCTWSSEYRNVQQGAVPANAVEPKKTMFG